MEMEQAQLLAHCGSSKITRDELKLTPTPGASPTHQPIPHNQIVEALVEGLSFRHISAIREEYAVSSDGMKMFGVLDLETTFDGCRFSVGIRNSNDKSMRLAVTVGYVQGELDVPKHLARRVHDLYFNPEVEQFASRTTWNLS